jgi:hypothetical protein
MLVIVTCILVAALASVVYSSGFEWVFHRYVMHRPVWKFTYPFKAHTLTHHKVFKADYTYHLQDPSLWRLIPMAWWNGVALIAINSVPVAIILVPFALFDMWSVVAAVGITCFVVFVGYYATYEIIHFRMHLPKDRRLQRSWIFQKLNGHHILHHRYMGTNFNVVLPLFDWLCGTLITRAKTHFAQVRGPGVPDIQPI